MDEAVSGSVGRDVGQVADISVIIPTYNRSSYLSGAIESALSQSLKPSEVIVIDDGSTDGTEALVRERFAGLVRFRKIPHSGLPSVARNVGIKEAEGSLVAFQDSDDFWVPERLERQLPLFERPEVVLAYGNAEVVTEGGERTGELVVPAGKAGSGRVFESLVNENFISTLTVTVRKSLLERIGGFNESPKLRGVEDYELWLRLARVGEFSYVDAPLALYRRHDANISGVSGSDTAVKQLIEVYRSVAAEANHEERQLLLGKLTGLYGNLAARGGWEGVMWRLRRSLASKGIQV